MSEELIKNNLIKKGLTFDNYEYFISIGATTLNQLKKAKIIKDKDYKSYSGLRPDGLIIDRSDRGNIQVICVIEFKKPSEFNTTEKRDIACKQCNIYCQLLESAFGIITDGKDFIWINPQIDFNKSEVRYFEKEILHNTSNIKRGFSYIKREDGYPLTLPLILDDKKSDETKTTLTLIKKIIIDISKDNSQFKQPKLINPSLLARSIWQDVWISKSASPEKSLSTFIEIFMFKFLSDLKVLLEDNNGNKVSFEDVYSKGETKCLKYYFDNSREYIKKLFPTNLKDNTTLINGISLNPSVKEDNQVFYRILKKFKDFGDLRNIDPEFKSRLFEDFLKKSISKKNWGQFFTPRSVVKAIIEMSEIEKLPDGSKVCDPACGVGGFLLEPIITKRPNDYFFKNGKLKSRIDYYGFERGFEQDDRITTILAKANFVIYLSELLRDNPNLASELANKFNEIFKIYIDTNLGSLSEINKEKYDLIMSNPPYVTRGSADYKKSIDRDAILKTEYSINAMGVEGLFVEKIMKEAKHEGKIFIVVPEGLLYRDADQRLREYILNNFNLNAVISLPKHTFYTTPQKTYILSLTKKIKNKINIMQTEPVFTYYVKDIGETLDKKRIPITENDLKDMSKQYKYFLVDKSNFQPLNIKCKIWNISNFKDNPNWLIIRWLSEEDRNELGIEEDKVIVKNWDDFKEDLDSISKSIIESKKELNNIGHPFKNVKYETMAFGEIFDIYDGFPFLSSIYTSKNEDIKLVRIQDVNNKSKIREVRIPIDFKFNENEEKNEEKIKQVWTKKGDYLISLSGAGGFNISKYSGEEGYLNQRIVRIRLKEQYEKHIIQDFIPIIFKEIKIELNKEGFGTNNNLNKHTLEEINIKIPITKNGDFDKVKQKELADIYLKLDKLKNKLITNLSNIQNSEIELD
jgi:type I restriction enzyme M protein